MFTVILEDASTRELLRSSLLGNEKFLLRKGDEFPILSQLDLSSYDVFSQSQASQLHRELNAVLLLVEDKEQRAHLQELMRLAIRGSNTEGSRIVFTPFSKE
jgi:hypothetical protein